jgi:hypothetical protein
MVVPCLSTLAVSATGRTSQRRGHARKPFVAKVRLKISPQNRNRLIVGAVLLGGAGSYYYFVGRRAFTADVRVICSEEARSETTIVSSRIVVETNARKKLTSGEGVQLLDTMKAAQPDSAARQLHAAADSMGVTDCPAAKSYDTLAKRATTAHAADRMCRRLEPATLGRMPKAKRFAELRDWTHSNIDDVSLDELLASVDSGTLDEKLAKLRSSLSDLGIHGCGVLAGMASGVDPVTGPNALVTSAAIQLDPREAVVTAALRDKVAAFRDCYAQGLKINSSIKGNVVMKFRLADSGVIDFAAVQADSPMQSVTVNACMVDVVKSVKGPTASKTSPGGLSVTFWVAD